MEKQRVFEWNLGVYRDYGGLRLEIVCPCALRSASSTYLGLSHLES